MLGGTQEDTANQEQTVDEQLQENIPAEQKNEQDQEDELLTNEPDG